MMGFFGVLMLSSLPVLFSEQVFLMVDGVVVHRFFIIVFRHV